HGTEYGGGMKSRFVHCLRHYQAHSTNCFDTDGDAPQRIIPRAPLGLAGGEHGGHDYRPCMHWAAFEGIVVVLAVCGSAIDEGRCGRAERLRVTDNGAWARVAPTSARGGNVVGVARDQTQAGDIEHESFA